MSGGIIFPNPANPGGQPNLNQLLKNKKSKANKKSGSASFLNPLAMLQQNADVFGALDNQKTAGSLAEAIEKQAAVQHQQAAAKSGGTADPYASLQQQLYDAANGINVAPTPLETLRQMANSQVAAQFDPQIAALVSDMTQHSNRAVKSEKTARKMYGALSQDYLSQLPDITAQYKAEDDATNARYDQAQQQMNDEYQKNAGAQDAMLKQLGIQAAAPDANAQQSADAAYFQNQSNLDQQSALNQLAEQQNAQVDYQRNMGSNASMAGENRAQDIASQLQDYLDAGNAQKLSLEGQKSATAAALLAQMQQQDQQRVATQSQNEFDNMMKLFNFQLSAQKASNSAANASGGGFGGGNGISSLTSGLPGAQNYLASVYPDQPIRASNLMEQLNNVLSDKAVTSGKFVLDPGNKSLGQAPKYSDVGQQYMEDLLRSQFEKAGNRYNTQDLNATMAALEAYLGKLR